jgi:hypothetical protein
MDDYTTLGCHEFSCLVCIDCHKILEDLIPEDYLPFLDDIGVKGPLSTYDGKEALPGIRQFVLEYI